MRRLVLVFTLLLAAPAHAAFTFEQPPFSPLAIPDAASAPEDVVTGDFDGDGKPDAVVNVRNAGLQLYRGTGSGSLGRVPGVLPGGTSTVDVAAADADADGDLDLVILTGAPEALSVLVNDGSGTFALGPATSLGAAYDPPGDLQSEISVGDLTGDGRADVVLPDSVAGDLRLFVGTPGLSFSEAVPIFTAAGTDPSTAIGDWDADGDADVLYTGMSGAVVFGNAGNGTFAPLSVSGDINEVGVFAQVDDDAGREAVSLDFMTLRVMIAPSEDPVVTTLPDTGRSLAAADLDSDGRDELIIASDGGLLVYHSNGDGTLTPTPTLVPATPPDYGLTTSDLNRDGRIDLLGTRYVSDQLVTLLNTSIAEHQLSGDTPMAFGLQFLGSVSAPKTVALTNTGHARLTVDRVAIGAPGVDGGAFLVTADDCTGAVLRRGQACDVGVRFAPSEGVNSTATLTITDSTGAPAIVALSGVGDTGALAPTGGQGPAGTGGPDGPIGPSGQVGPVGPAGANGLNGADGADGAAGLAGPTGPAGATGPAGSAGATGAKGERGPDGPAGPAQIVVCKTTGRGRKLDVACSVTAARAGTARLMRHGRVVRRARVARGRQVLRFRVNRPGIYRLKVPG